MFRGIQVMNKICAKKQKEKDDEKLVNQLRKIKKSTSNYNFRKDDKVKIYKRNNFQDGVRVREIKHENLILAKKIKNIGKDLKLSLPSSVKKAPRVNSPPKGPNASSKPVTGNIKSLNQESRKKELLRITMDNMNLMHRIKSMKSMYNQKDWKEHNMKHFGYFKIHCEYPIVMENEMAMLEEFNKNQNKSVTL